MTKLPKNTLQNIEISEIIALVQENKAISGFKEYFREQVQSSLENKEKFRKEDFEKIKENIENIKEYQKVLEKEFPKKSFSLELVEKLKFWQTLEEFEEFCNIRVRTLLKWANNDMLEFVLDKYYINNLYDFIKLAYNVNFIDILEHKNIGTLELVLNKFKIKNLDKLIDIYNILNVRYILAKAKKENLEYAIELLNIQTIQEFEEFISNDYVKRILEESNLETLQLIIDFLDINESNFNIFAFNTNILELSINIDSEILIYLLDLYEIKNWINGISNLNKFASTYSSTARNFKKWRLENLKIFDRDIQKQMIDEIWAYPLNKLEKDFDKIKNHKYWKEFWFFIEAPKHWRHFSFPETFPVNTSNFLDFMQDGEILFDFEISWTKLDLTLPWTKAWFLENPERIEYMNSFNLGNLNKFWLIPWNSTNAISSFSAKNIDLWESLAEFVDKKVIPSKHNTKIFTENNITPSDVFNKVLTYYLKNKQNQIISMMEKLSFIEEFWLDIKLDNFKTLDNFKYENWELKIDELKPIFLKILKLNWENKQTKLLNQFDNFVTRKNIKWLEKLLAENFIKYFDYIYHKKIKIKVISSIKSSLWEENIDFEKIDNSKLDREEFIEAYKMSLNPSYNKRQINRLLLDYLTWKFDNLEELNQYKTTGNINWLDKNLSKEQQNIWLSKNRKEINIDNDFNDENQENYSDENLESRINNHIEISIKKIEDLNELWFEFETHFENKWEIKKYFNLEIKKKEEEIKTKIWDSNIYEDLKFQINTILKLEKNNSDFKAKKFSKIIIERELDPIKSLMMWNRVDWSCLSFYNSIWNYYSAISNTIDANKGVYYIKNEDWNLLWRCLITIWEDKKISRYKMYYSWRVDVPIDKYFDEYTLELSKKIWLELNWDQDNVKNIECDRWYQDGTQKI